VLLGQVETASGPFVRKRTISENVSSPRPRQSFLNSSCVSTRSLLIRPRLPSPFLELD
jgi:hypothetical protein